MQDTCHCDSCPSGLQKPDHLLEPMMVIQHKGCCSPISTNWSIWHCFWYFIKDFVNLYLESRLLNILDLGNLITVPDQINNTWSEIVLIIGYSRSAIILIISHTRLTIILIISHTRPGIILIIGYQRCKMINNHQRHITETRQEKCWKKVVYSPKCFYPFLVQKVNV